MPCIVYSVANGSGICSHSEVRLRSRPQRRLDHFYPCSPSAMFYVIGLGLCDEKDITLRGLEVGAQPTETYSIFDGENQAVKSCSRVYLEAYTSILMVEKSRLVCTVLDIHLQVLTVWKVGGVL